MCRCGKTALSVSRPGALHCPDGLDGSRDWPRVLTRIFQRYCSATGSNMEWLPTRPCPTPPTPTPPQREGITQNMRLPLIKNCCDTGAERGQNKGHRMPWRRQNESQQAWPQLATPGGKSCSSSRKILGSTCKTAELGKSLKPGPAHSPGQQPTLWEGVWSV